MALSIIGRIAMSLRRDVPPGHRWRKCWRRRIVVAVDGIIRKRTTMMMIDTKNITAAAMLLSVAAFNASAARSMRATELVVSIRPKCG